MVSSTSTVRGHSVRLAQLADGSIRIAALTALSFCLCSMAQAADRPVRRVVSMDYPRLALLARVQGVVSVECVIDQGGRVTSAKAVSGNALLAKAALENIREWAFQEGTQGISAEATQTVVYRFVLEGEVPKNNIPTTKFVFEVPNKASVISQEVHVMIGAIARRSTEPAPAPRRERR